ncbi:hypothetical protein EI28_10505 [Methanoculleus sp. MH98A]|nr:hypothetical protein EI28_10505 [Methanoculleus sp. MH98A]
MSCQKPYVHWEAFSERIHGAFDRFREVIGTDAIGTMNLRYVNFIEIPEREVTLSDYFAFYPTLPPELPQVPAGSSPGASSRSTTTATTAGWNSPTPSPNRRSTTRTS